jgi:hypothetical protein
LPNADERPVMQDLTDDFTHMGQFPGHKTGSTRPQDRVDHVESAAVEADSQSPG